MDFVTFLRQYKIGPFAIFDLAVSYLGIYLLAPLLSKGMELIGLRVSRASWMWLTLPLGILFHLIFKQDTPLNKMFFDPSGGYIAKIVIVGMLVVGLLQIRKR